MIPEEVDGTESRLAFAGPTMGSSLKIDHVESRLQFLLAGSNPNYFHYYYYYYNYYYYYYGYCYYCYY